MGACSVPVPVADAPQLPQNHGLFLKPPFRRQTDDPKVSSAVAAQDGQTLAKETGRLQVARMAPRKVTRHSLETPCWQAVWFVLTARQG